MSASNILDIVLVIIMALAAIGGWRTSGTARVGRLAGLLLGALVGLAIAPIITPATASVGLQVVITIGLLLVGAVVLGAVGGRIGLAVAEGLGRLHLGMVDRLLGALLSGLIALLGCWLLLNIAAILWPDSGLAGATDTSRLIEAVDNALPRFTNGVR